MRPFSRANSLYLTHLSTFSPPEDINQRWNVLTPASDVMNDRSALFEFRRFYLYINRQTKYKRIQRLINIKIAKAYRTISYDAACVIAGVQPIQITIEQKIQTYMATKINNLEYDAPLEVRYWRHPAELAIVHEMENGTMYTAEVYTDGSKIGDNVGAAGIIFENGKLVQYTN